MQYFGYFDILIIRSMVFGLRSLVFGLWFQIILKPPNLLTIYFITLNFQRKLNKL